MTSVVGVDRKSHAATIAIDTSNNVKDMRKLITAEQNGGNKMNISRRLAMRLGCPHLENALKCSRASKDDAPEAKELSCFTNHQMKIGVW